MPPVKTVLGIDVDVWQVISVIFSAIVSTTALCCTLFESRRNSRESKHMIEESTRANISIYTAAPVANKGWFYIVFKNFGKTSALVKSIEADETTKYAIKLKDDHFISYANNTSLAPGQSMTLLVVSNNLPTNHLSKICLKYISSSNNKEYESTFNGNLDNQHKLPSPTIHSDHTVEDYLKIYVELYQDSIRKSL